MGCERGKKELKGPQNFLELEQALSDVIGDYKTGLDRPDSDDSEDEAALGMLDLSSERIEYLSDNESED
eukprot:SAG31_NODE_112_length_24420_cov_19.787550_10_plen_69_part_00